MKRTAFIVFLVAALAVTSGTAYAAPAAQQVQSQCLIVAPATGSQVRGQVAVQGSATHPDFTWYQVGYAPEPNPTGEWTFFSNSESSVNNGQLAVWDTRALRDGTYQLLLEVHRSDGNFDLCFSTKIRVVNTQPTPTFTAVPLPTTADTPTPLPTPEATATVLVEQPPTATPRATPTYSAVDNPTPTPEETRFQLPIEAGSIRNASCRGAQLTVLAAVAIALYFAFRSLAVNGLRKLRKSDDVQGFHRRRPREF
ncbi:MAG: hypothetical protein JXA09_16435 [Anaerolineae bacterium]|nr:hypothetical protein [Anaerolineae bacterium]